METELLTVSSRPSGLVIRVHARQLHMYHIPDFKEHIKKLLAAKPVRIIFDLEEVEYLDSSAMGALFQIHKEIQTYGGRMVLVHINQTIRMVFRLTKSDQFFVIKETLQEAEES